MTLKGAHVLDFDFAKHLTPPDFLRSLFNARAYDSMIAMPVRRFGASVKGVYVAPVNLTRFVEREPLARGLCQPD